MEALRAMVRDIPRMLSASKICRLQNKEALRLDPVVGGCHNVLLDDVMEDYGDALEL